MNDEKISLYPVRYVAYGVDLARPLVGRSSSQRCGGARDGELGHGGSLRRGGPTGADLSRFVAMLWEFPTDGPAPDIHPELLAAISDEQLRIDGLRAQLDAAPLPEGWRWETTLTISAVGDSSWLVRSTLVPVEATG